ncbi:hypothetical protein EJB05_39667, partial [Eragrostis curvula]
MATNPGSSPNNQFLGETSSTCQTQSITVAHKFQMPDFALLEGMGIGKYVSSSNFSVGDCDWNLKVYPDGNTGGEQGIPVSVFLHFLRGTPGVRVKFRLSSVDKDGAQLWPLQDPSLLSELRDSYMLSKTFHSVGQECGLTNFIPRIKLKQCLSRTGGCFIVNSELTCPDRAPSHLPDRVWQRAIDASREVSLASRYTTHQGKASVKAQPGRRELRSMSSATAGSHTAGRGRGRDRGYVSLHACMHGVWSE